MKALRRASLSTLSDIVHASLEPDFTVVAFRVDPRSRSDDDSLTGA
jgi:hypothetical protein